MPLPTWPGHSRFQFLFFAATAVVVVALPLPGADDPEPTRAAFINEVLDAKPTPVTKMFYDREGSYHVEKEDLLKGLTEEAAKRKLTLRAVSIIGPLPGDMLWTSYVVVFIQEGESVRVNCLVMPHARITFKSTGLITAERYKKWLEEVSATGVLQKEAPPGAEGEEKKAADPFGPDIVLVTWSEDGKSQEVFHGSGLHEKTKALIEHYNALFKELKKTYPEEK